MSFPHAQRVCELSRRPASCSAVITRKRCPKSNGHPRYATPNFSWVDFFFERALMIAVPARRLGRDRVRSTTLVSSVDRTSEPCWAPVSRAERSRSPASSGSQHA